MGQLIYAGSTIGLTDSVLVHGPPRPRFMVMVARFAVHFGREKIVDRNAQMVGDPQCRFSVQGVLFAPQQPTQIRVGAPPCGRRQRALGFLLANHQPLQPLAVPQDHVHLPKVVRLTPSRHYIFLSVVSSIPVHWTTSGAHRARKYNRVFSELGSDLRLSLDNWPVDLCPP